MDDVERLIANNRVWSQRARRDDPAFFRRLAEQQAPRYLWVGCSDSRVPANEIVGLLPGEIFVHRNVANLIIPTDMNCLSAIQYAIDALQVAHVMVVGHYGCGGIQAVLERRSVGLADNWLHHVEDMRHIHGRRLDALPSDAERVDRLCELNVIEQVARLTRLPLVQQAWARNQALTLHGFIYGLHDGLLRNMGATIDGPVDVAGWRRSALAALWRRPTARNVPESGLTRHGLVSDTPADAPAHACDHHDH